MADKIENAMLDILKQIQAGQTAIKKEIRSEVGSLRTELGLIQQQLMTMNGMISHNRSEFMRIEDRIARLEAHVGIDDMPAAH